MSDSIMWAIWPEKALGTLTIMRANGVEADSEGPTLSSREEFERFVSELRWAAAQVWTTDG